VSSLEAGLLHLYCPTSYVPLPVWDIYGHRYLRRVRADMQVRATRSPSATARDFTLPRVRTSGFLESGCAWTPQAMLIAVISMDMSPAYQSGASRFFPQAQIVFDRFHLMQMAGQAADKVRKELARAGADLKGSLWALRGNEWTRSEEQPQQRSALCNRYPKLGRAIGLRGMLQDVLADEDEEALRWWCKRAKLSRLQPFRELAQSIQEHWSGESKIGSANRSDALVRQRP
jgi:transposase